MQNFCKDQLLDLNATQPPLTKLKRPRTTLYDRAKEDTMKDPFKQHGGFSWFELMSSDVEAAKKFYAGLFGWNTEDMSMGDMNYTVVKVGEEGLGGMMTVPPQAEGTPPHWGVYVTVDDVDATAARAEKLGGKILVPPTDIPTVGRFSVLQDPQGALISAITDSHNE
jgi:predicted enzyme related to lactoylglutathione lyase